MLIARRWFGCVVVLMPTKVSKGSAESKDETADGFNNGEECERWVEKVQRYITFVLADARPSSKHSLRAVGGNTRLMTMMRRKHSIQISGMNILIYPLCLGRCLAELDTFTGVND